MSAVSTVRTAAGAGPRSGAAGASPRSRGTFVGTGTAARLALRRSRWFWLVWVLALWAIMPTTTTTYHRLVTDGAGSQATMAALASNPTMRAMLGPPYDLMNAGGFVMWRVGTFVAAAAAMMGALGVMRATRAEEEEGRTELLRAGVVGRHAPLAGAITVGLGACGLLALLITASMAAVAPPLAGALASGLGIGLVGAVWVGVGAVTAQVTASARAARGMALGVLAVAYVIRAVADGLPEDSAATWLRWVSPVEWAALGRPYAQERWWVLLLPIVLTAALVVVAFALVSRRDYGAGLRAASPGRARAVPSLDSAAALALRLDRGSMIGWAIGLALFGLAIGSLSGTVDQMLVDNPQMAELFRRMGGGGQLLRDAFFVAMLGIVVVLIAAFGVQLMLRLRKEEEAGHAELLLSTATSRTRLVLAHLVPALVGSTVLLVGTGAAVALPQAVAEGSARVVVQIAAAALALAPGVWLTIGITMAVLGWLPHWTALPWAVVAWSLFMSWFASLLELPERLIKLTPFGHLPQIPVQPMAWTPVLVVTALAAALIALGLAGYRRRDITP